MRQRCQGVYIQINCHHTKREPPRPHPPQSREGQQGWARPGNSVPRIGPQLVLSQRRLKNWPKSGVSIAETTGPNVLVRVFTTTSSSSGCPTTNASRRSTLHMHIVTTAATPCNSYVRVDPTITNSMLQQRQHRQSDKQLAVLRNRASRSLRRPGLTC